MDYPKVRVTYAREDLIDPDNDSWERLKFLSDNCFKLAQFLETLPYNRHNQSSWVFGTNVQNQCQSRGCALGWAVMTHLIKGLQFTTDDEGFITGPTVNGDESDWLTAGTQFFGHNVVETVFRNTFRNRKETIQVLYYHAEHLCKQARQCKVEQQEA